MVSLYKFRFMTLSVFAIACLCLFLPHAKAQDRFGTVVGTFNGVTAYSNYNDPNPYPGVKNWIGTYCTGYKWACVEYANRYYYSVYGMKIAGGNANTYYGAAASKGLKSYANGGTVRPAVGDILCSSSGSQGHVAIIREVGPDSCPYIVIIQQNWSNSSADNAKTLLMSVNNGRYTVSAAGSYSWQGWLRK